jgi:small ligand-binding sensory domain FIST
MVLMTADRDLDIVTELRLLAELADSADLGLVMLSGRSFTDAADQIDALRARLTSAEVEW